jgi:hypothetical protein
MLRQRALFDFRSAMRPLAWLAACTVATSTVPAYAQSADGEDVDTSFASSPESEGEPSSPSWLEARWSALTGRVSPLGAAAVDAPRSSAASPPAPPPPPKDDGAGLRTVGYVAGGVGIAGFILFAVAGIGAKNAHDRLDEACNAGRCNDPSLDGDIADGKLLQTAANIGLATGLTGLGLGATLIVLGGRSSGDAMPAVGSSAPGGMVSFAGRF